MSTTRDNSCGVGMVKRASFMCTEYVELSPPRVRKNGKTSSATVLCISADSSCLNLDHRRCC